MVQQWDDLCSKYSDAKSEDIHDGKNQGLTFQIIVLALLTYHLPVFIMTLCPNYSPWVKFNPTPGITSFTFAHVGKTLEISPYQAIRLRVKKFYMALSGGPLPRVPKL